MNLIDLVQEFGPAIGIVLFFLGRDAAREERMVATINEQNEFIRGELIKLIKNCETQDFDNK